MWFTEAIVLADGKIGLRRPRWPKNNSVLIPLADTKEIFNIPESNRYPAIKNIDYLADDWELRPEEKEKRYDIVICPDYSLLSLAHLGFPSGRSGTAKTKEEMHKLIDDLE